MVKNEKNSRKMHLDLNRSMNNTTMINRMLPISQGVRLTLSRKKVKYRNDRTGETTIFPLIFRESEVPTNSEGPDNYATASDSIIYDHINLDKYKIFHFYILKEYADKILLFKLFRQLERLQQLYPHLVENTVLEPHNRLVVWQWSIANQD